MMSLLRLDRIGQLLTGSFLAGMQDNLTTYMGLNYFYPVWCISVLKTQIHFVLDSDLCC